MGYYTQYSIEVIEGDPRGIIEELIADYEDAAHALDEDGGCREECKWYDSDANMREFSKKHPEHLFRLEGIGEESGDIWHQYWKNGKSQYVKAEIVYAPYDPQLLTD